MEWERCEYCNNLRPTVDGNYLVLNSARKYLTENEPVTIPHETGDLQAYIYGASGVGFSAKCDVPVAGVVKVFAYTYDEVVDAILETVLAENPGEPDLPDEEALRRYIYPPWPDHESIKAKVWTLNHYAKTQMKPKDPTSVADIAVKLGNVMDKLKELGHERHKAFAYVFSVAGTVNPHSMAGKLTSGGLMVLQEDMLNRSKADSTKVVERGVKMLKEVGVELKD